MGLVLVMMASVGMIELDVSWLDFYLGVLQLIVSVMIASIR